MNVVPGSTADLPDWTAAEEAEVRDLLERAQRDLVVGPAPWPELLRRRRVARARRAGAVVAVAASAALVAGPAGGLLPGLDRLPGVSVHRSDVAGLPREGGTVGSLAGDTAFLAALRTRAVAELENQDGVQDAEVSAVLLATDLPGGRIALVAFRVPGGPEQVYWLKGGEGGAASRMYLTDSCDLAEPCWTRYGDGPDSVPDRKPDGSVVPPTSRGQGVILAGPRDATVTVQVGNDVTAEGTVRPNRVAAVERWPGVYVAPLPTIDGRQDVDVRVPGSKPWSSSFYGGSQLDFEAWWVAGSVPGAARPVTDPLERGDLLSVAQRVAGMTADSGDRVLYQSSVDGQARAVLAFRGRSGGWLLMSAHRTTTSANTFDLGVDAARAVPGGDPADPTAGLDRVCLAWRTPDRDDGRLLEVLGPASAAHALLVVVGNDADTVDLPLDRGVGSTRDVPAVGQVVLLDQDRHELGGCEVSAPRSDTDVVR